MGVQRQLLVFATKDSLSAASRTLSAVIVLDGWLAVNVIQQAHLQDVTESRLTNWFRRHKRGIPRLDRERQLPVLS